MYTNHLSVVDACETLGFSRSYFYKILKKEGINPIKKSGKSYVSKDFVNQLLDQRRQDTNRGDAKETKSTEKPDAQGFGEETNRKQTGDEQETVKQESPALVLELRNQISELKKGIEVKDGKIENLLQEVGRWQGRASTLEDRLLRLEAPRQSNHTQAEEIIICSSPASKQETFEGDKGYKQETRTSEKPDTQGIHEETKRSQVGDEQETRSIKSGGWFGRFFSFGKRKKIHPTQDRRGEKRAA